MKNLYTIILFAFITFSANVNAQIVNIPDHNFYNALLANGVHDSVGYITVDTAKAFRGSLNVSKDNITDLTGIAAFTAITSLKCDSNQLTNLDVSSNTALTTLYCNHNSLTSLDVKNGNNHNMHNSNFNATNNAGLTCIQVDNSVYSTINWEQRDSQSYFSCNCSAGPVVFIPDVNFKTQLLAASAINTNGDCEIQVSEARAYTGLLNVSNDSIADLTGIAAFTAITYLKCDSNQLTSLDVSSNTALSTLYCDNNSLTSLDVKNGNNSNMYNSNFNATNNAGLTCIQVDNSVYSTVNWKQRDSQAYFSCNCSAGPVVFIPDVNFKAQLLAVSSINTNRDCEIQVSEAEAFTGIVNVSNSNISDLTGIEAFTNITGLECGFNNLTSVDILHNTALTYFNCGVNSLTSLDVSSNAALTVLWCFYNNLTNLDVSHNTALVSFACNNNNLTDLDVKNGNDQNIDSTDFWADNNSDSLCIQVDNVAYSTANWHNIDSTAHFSTDCNFPFAVYNIAAIGDVSVYPNPATNELTISGNWDVSQNYLLTITNLLGETIYTQTVSSKQETVNCKQFPSGLYFLHLADENESWVGKFVKE